MIFLYELNLYKNYKISYNICSSTINIKKIFNVPAVYQFFDLGSIRLIKKKIGPSLKMVLNSF